MFSAMFVCVLGIQGQSMSGRQTLADLAIKATLNRSDMKPWHMRVSFTVYEMDGSLKENGTMDEWWVAPHQLKLTIKSPSFNYSLPAELDLLPVANRESFLIESLREEMIDPVRGKMDLPLSSKDVRRTYDGIDLLCTRAEPSGQMRDAELCRESDSDKLRISTNIGGFLAIRNELSIFENTQVAKDIAICFGEKLLIQGHIDLLERIDVPLPALDLTPADSPSENAAGDSWSFNVKKRHKAVYPDAARQAKVHGDVVLTAVIAKDGHLSSLDVISSPHPALTASAIEAVKRGTFSPPSFQHRPINAVLCLIITFWPD
jgi:TonB family protein